MVRTLASVRRGRNCGLGAAGSSREPPRQAALHFAAAFPAVPRPAFEPVFGGQESGLPGFALPWQERRIEVPDLRVELAPARVADPKPAIPSAPVPSPSVLTGQTAAGEPLVVTFRSPKRPPVRPATASVPRNTPKAKAGPKAVAGAVPANASGSTSKAKASPKPVSYTHLTLPTNREV